MTEDNHSPNTDGAAEHAADGAEEQFHRAGQRLAAAREELGLSLEQVSERLKISPPYLRALESCDYDQLPGTTFIRGYLRSYARLVGLDEQAILELYGETVQADEQVARLLREKPLDTHGPQGGRGLMIFGLLLLLGFVAASVYWWRNEPQAAPATGSQPRQTAPVEADGLQPREPAPPKAAESQEPAAVTDDLPEPETKGLSELQQASGSTVEPEQAEVVSVTARPQPALASDAQPAVASSEDALVVRFNDECWIEVRDAGDNVLFSAVKPADSELSLEGEAPLHIKLGSVSAVAEIEFNGEPVDTTIPASSTGVGRLTLG